MAANQPSKRVDKPQLQQLGGIDTIIIAELHKFRPSKPVNNINIIIEDK